MICDISGLKGCILSHSLRPSPPPYTHHFLMSWGDSVPSFLPSSPCENTVSSLLPFTLQPEKISLKHKYCPIFPLTWLLHCLLISARKVRHNMRLPQIWVLSAFLSHCTPLSPSSFIFPYLCSKCVKLFATFLVLGALSYLCFSHMCSLSGCSPSSTRGNPAPTCLTTVFLCCLASAWL